MNTTIIIAGMICATVVVIVIIACVHDTIAKTIETRTMRNFEKAFKNFDVVNMSNNEHLKQEKAAESQPLDFPNDHVETRPRIYR